MNLWISSFHFSLFPVCHFRSNVEQKFKKTQEERDVFRPMLRRPSATGVTSQHHTRDTQHLVPHTVDVQHLVQSYRGVQHVMWCSRPLTPTLMSATMKRGRHNCTFRIIQMTFSSMLYFVSFPLEFDRNRFFRLCRFSLRFIHTERLLFMIGPNQVKTD